MRTGNCGTLFRTISLSFVILTCEFQVNHAGNTKEHDHLHPFGFPQRTRRSTGSGGAGDAAEDVFNALVPKDYNLYELPPKINGEPTQMNLTMLLFNIRDVKEIGEELTLELNMQMQWKDSRLNPEAEFTARNITNYIIVTPTLLQKLWYPDIYIDHVKSVSQPVLVSKPASLRIYRDGTIRYSTRLTITSSCQFDFHYYPADTQRCHLDIKSYAYTGRDLYLKWKSAAFAFRLEAPNFYIGMDKTESFEVKTSSGTYTGLRLTVTLTRNLSYHLIQTYLPSFLLVVVSWLSFLVPPESVPGRVAICMTCLLSLIAMFASVRQSVPNVSYVKALDIWMVNCTFFVFLSLAEFTIVLKLLHIKPKRKIGDVPTLINAKGEMITDQAIALNHLHARRGARGSVATVYYPGVGAAQSLTQLQHRVRRQSIPLSPATLPRDHHHQHQQNNTDEEDTQTSYSRENILQQQNSLHPAGGEGGNRFHTTGGRSAVLLPASSHSSLHEPTFVRPFMNAAPIPMHVVEKPQYAKLVKRIEICSSFIVPLLFFAFNLVYWPWLIASSQYLAQDDSRTVFYSAK